jgi:hypothetical protein
MSILDTNIQPNLAEQSAKQIINQARQTFHQITESFNDGTVLFWSNPYGLEPSKIAEALGTNAVEIFRLHYALGQFIASIKPEAISNSLSLIGQFTMNEDGTVTVINNNNLPPVTPQNFNASLIDDR